MGRHEIIEKLDRELKKDIREECQVVYILSRIRKILEANRVDGNGEAEGDRYPLLNFYCNWSLHYVMDKPSTQRLINNLLAEGLDCKKSAKDLAGMLKLKYPDFFKLSSLELQLRGFLIVHQLSLDLLDNEWSNFRQILLKIIKETPIRFASGVLREIELILDDNSDYCYKFSLVDKRDKPIVKLKFK